MSQTSIISPFLIYLINTLSNIAFAILILIGTLFVIFILMVCGCMVYRLDEDEKYNDLIPKIKICIKCIIVCTIFYVFIPSKNTCYQMLATSVITYENVDAGKETVKSAIDYVFEKIDEINNVDNK